MDKFVWVFIFYFLLLFCLSFHEMAHAWMAHMLGDDTAKMEGRITMNPIVHIHPIGTVLLPLLCMLSGVGFFGWAKPVPFNPVYFRRSISVTTGSMLVALAGPVSNLLLAGIAALAYRLFFANGDLNIAGELLAYSVRINITLAVFNMLPFFPLDGEKVLRGLIPRSLFPALDHLSRYSMYFLIFFYAAGFLRYLTIPVEYLTQLLLS